MTKGKSFLVKHKEKILFACFLIGFSILYMLNLPKHTYGNNIIIDSLYSGLFMAQDYAKEHTLTCLVPAFFIAGSISIFLNKGSIIKLLGKSANRWVSYSVASLSGGVLAVCSCTILPIFEGIRKKGAGLGPAITFLFSGPAINVTAIFLMAKVFGWNYSVYRLLASIVIAIISGLIMSFIFKENTMEGDIFVGDDETGYSKSIVALFFISQISILFSFSIRGIPTSIKLLIIGVSILIFLGIIFFVYSKSDRNIYLLEVWEFVKRILPYLFIGIFIAGILSVIVPQSLIVSIVGSNTLLSNLIGGTFGMVTYFATLTEIPIVQGFVNLGMSKGPSMTLFLTGNSLSLPSFLVLIKSLGVKKVLVYYFIVLVLSSFAGYLFGVLY